MKYLQNKQGYTLMEMMIVLTIISIISGAILLGMNSVIRAKQKMDKQSDFNQYGRFVTARIVNELRHATSIQISSGGNEVHYKKSESDDELVIRVDNKGKGKFDSGEEKDQGVGGNKQTERDIIPAKSANDHINTNPYGKAQLDSLDFTINPQDQKNIIVIVKLTDKSKNPPKIYKTSIKALNCTPEKSEGENNSL